MISDFLALSHQLNETDSPEIRAAYLALSHTRLPGGWVVHVTSHGFISRELRFEKSGNWYFSAVLNKQWVLFYFRSPAFRDSIVDWNEVKTTFPDATVAQINNLSLRVRSPEEALSLSGFLWPPQG